VRRDGHGRGIETLTVLASGQASAAVGAPKGEDRAVRSRRACGGGRSAGLDDSGGGRRRDRGQSGDRALLHGGRRPCTGEPVAVEGTLVILSRTTVSEAGGPSSSIWLLPDAVTAVGVETGASYVYRSVTGSSFTLQQGTSVADTSTLALIRPGSGGNLLVRILLHETLTATGEVTALVENGGATCTG
jgi:hypothetical protein